MLVFPVAMLWKMIVACAMIILPMIVRKTVRVSGAETIYAAVLIVLQRTIITLPLLMMAAVKDSLIMVSSSSVSMVWMILWT